MQRTFTNGDREMTYTQEHLLDLISRQTTKYEVVEPNQPNVERARELNAEIDRLKALGYTPHQIALLMTNPEYEKVLQPRKEKV